MNIGESFPSYKKIPPFLYIARERECDVKNYWSVAGYGSSRSLQHEEIVSSDALAGFALSNQIKIHQL